MLVESVNVTDASCRSASCAGAETVRFGASCMVDDQIPHFARLKTHDQGIALAICNTFQEARASRNLAICLS
jgi:hypothetical protein